MMMKNIRLISLSLLICLSSFCLATSKSTTVVYWNSPEAISMQQRLSENADFWRIVPHLTTQKTQTYCGIASAITVLNALGSSQYGDLVYYPHTYLTQDSFFTPSVLPYLSPKIVMSRGTDITELHYALETHGVQVKTIYGDSVSAHQLRSLLSKALVNSDHYVLINYQRACIRQRGGGHWSVLGAYDAESDRVLIMDVARFHYLPAWVQIPDLLKAMNTIDPRGNARGLLIVTGQPRSKA